MQTKGNKVRKGTRAFRFPGSDRHTHRYFSLAVPELILNLIVLNTTF